MRTKLLKTLIYPISFILVILLVIFLRVDRNVEFIGTILGVSTFLFGIFLAFSLSDRHNRIDQIRENDSGERSQMIFLFDTSKIFGKVFQKRLQNAIDKYIMATLDYKIWDYEKTEKEYKKVVEVALSAKLRDKKDASFFSYFIEATNNLGMARKHTIGLISDRLSVFEWTTFFLFSVVIVGSLVLLNLGTIVSIIIIAIISFSIILLLSFLYDLDNLSWKEEIRIFEPYAKTFESIGLLRYYPEALIKQRRVNLHKGKKCRIGVFPHPYPNLKGKKIKLIKF